MSVETETLRLTEDEKRRDIANRAVHERAEMTPPPQILTPEKLLSTARACLDALETLEEDYEGESVLEVLEYVWQYHEHRTDDTSEPHALYARLLRTLVGGQE